MARMGKQKLGNQKLRRQIVFEAARLMYSRHETEYYRAKMKAARKVCHGWIKPSDLPSNQEIRSEVQRFAVLYEGDQRDDRLLEMRIEALRIMRLLKSWRPRLIGSTLTGFVRQGSDIDIHVFTSSLEAVTGVLDQEGMTYDVERKFVRRWNRQFVHVHIQDRFPVELTLYPPAESHVVQRSSITGKSMERASVAELEKLLGSVYADLDLEDAVFQAENRVDRFQVYRALLMPLAKVEQSRKYHPEGDVLYHSLQVFDLACEELPYDEEFLLAALLHDVGKGIDPQDHVEAGLQALDDLITPRTVWLIRFHMHMHQLKAGTLGVRARRRLRQSEDFEELEILGRCDRDGRVAGAPASDLDDALDYIRDLSQHYG